MCFDVLYDFCLKSLPFWEEFSEVSYLYICLDVQYLLFLSDFENDPQIQNFMNICPVVAELSYVDRHGEANSRFFQFSECI